MKVKSTTRRVIRCAAAVSALSAMICFAGVAEAYAATAEQVSATTDSITVKFNIDPKYQNVQMGAVEIKQSSSDEWTTIPKDNIPTLNAQEAVLVNLDAGTKLSQVKFNYTYNNPGSNTTLRSWATISDPVTVPNKTSGLKIDGQFSYTKKLRFSFKVPATYAGYEVQLKAKSGSKNNVNYRYTRSDSNYGSKTGKEVTSYIDAKLNTAYTAKVRLFVSMKDASKTKIYSEWSTPVMLIPQPVVTGKRYDTRAEMKWTKIAGVKNYTVYASAKKDKDYKKVATTKSTKYTITKVNGKKMKKGKTYYYYVKANAKVNGKSYSSPFMNYYYR